MHYQSNSELPGDIQRALPPEAQTIYRKAYNAAFPERRERIEHFSEERAHEAAWKAVRESFEEQDGQWHKRSTS